MELCLILRIHEESLSCILNHQFIQKLKLVVEGKFNYISLTVLMTGLADMEAYIKLGKN